MQTVTGPFLVTNVVKLPQQHVNVLMGSFALCIVLHHEGITNFQARALEFKFPFHKRF